MQIKSPDRLTRVLALGHALWPPPAAAPIQEGDFRAKPWQRLQVAEWTSPIREPDGQAISSRPGFAERHSIDHPGNAFERMPTDGHLNDQAGSRLDLMVTNGRWANQ